MINSLDLVIGTTILIIGMAYWSVSILEHNNNYVDAVKADYLFDKGIKTMEHLSEDGTLQNAVLLYYFGKVNESKKLLEENIPLNNNYVLYIDNHLLINKTTKNYNNTIYVLTVLTLNRSEGWYVIYGDENNIDISNERYLDYDEAFSHYENYSIDMPVYLSKNVTTSRVKLIIYS